MSQFLILTRSGYFMISQDQYQYVVGALADMHPMITLDRIKNSDTQTVDAVFMKEAIYGVTKDERDKEE